MYTKELYRRAQAITHSLDSPWSGMTIGPALEAAILSGNNTGYNILAQEYNNGINGTLSEDEAKKEWIALKPTAAIQDLSGQSVIGTKQPFNSSNTLG